MKEVQYYYLNGTQQMGPFKLETLKHAPIKPDTLVWYNELPDWVEARSLPELQFIFIKSSTYTVPPIPEVKKIPQSAGNFKYNSKYLNNTEMRPPMPENYLVWGILTTIFCCMPLGIVSIISATKVSSIYLTGDYVAAKKASEDAKKWAIWSALSIFVLVGLYLLVYIFIIIFGLTVAATNA